MTPEVGVRPPREEQPPQQLGGLPGEVVGALRFRRPHRLAQRLLCQENVKGHPDVVIAVGTVLLVVVERGGQA